MDTNNMNQQTNTGQENSRQTVFIVEDDAFLTRAYEVMLEAQGYTVEATDDGEAAVKKFESGFVPGVMLLDLMLPRKSGFEVLEAMQRNEALKDVPVIVLSNLGQQTDKDRAMELGAKAYFVKADTPLERVVQEIEKYIE